MEIIGQDKILNFINSHNLSTIPRTILLEGLNGSGRHSVCKYISELYQIDMEDISDNLNYDYIENIMLRTSPWIYIIDSSKLSVKNENAILKFLEEPLKNSIIVLICENRHALLDTIRNRCYCITMEKYTKEQLTQFLPPWEEAALILELSETPGDVKNFQNVSVQELLALCHKIFDKIATATVANTLTLANNLAFKNEKDKYDVAIFMRALVKCAYDRMVSNVQSALSDYMLTTDYYNRFFVKNVDKKYLFESYLLSLKRSRGM